MCCTLRITSYLFFYQSQSQVKSCLGAKTPDWLVFQNFCFWTLFYLRTHCSFSFQITFRMEKPCVCVHASMHQRTNFWVFACHPPWVSRKLARSLLSRLVWLASRPQGYQTTVLGSQVRHYIQLFFFFFWHEFWGPHSGSQKHFIDRLLPPSPQKNFLKNHKSLPYENLQGFPTYLQNV